MGKKVIFTLVVLVLVGGAFLAGVYLNGGTLEGLIRLNKTTKPISDLSVVQQSGVQQNVNEAINLGNVKSFNLQQAQIDAKTQSQREMVEEILDEIRKVMDEQAEIEEAGTDMDVEQRGPIFVDLDMPEVESGSVVCNLEQEFLYSYREELDSDIDFLYRDFVKFYDDLEKEIESSNCYYRFIFRNAVGEHEYYCVASELLLYESDESYFITCDKKSSDLDIGFDVVYMSDFDELWFYLNIIGGLVDFTDMFKVDQFYVQRVNKMLID